MQIERKPNRWPYLGLLIGLLVACIFAPWNWRLDEPVDSAADEPAPPSPSSAVPTDPLENYIGRSIGGGTSAAPYLFSRAPSLDTMATFGLLSNHSGPFPTRLAQAVPGAPSGLTMDELISTLNPAAQALGIGQLPSSAAPMVSLRVPAATSWTVPGRCDSASATPAIPDVRVAAALRWLGEVIAGYSPTAAARWLGESLTSHWKRFRVEAIVSEPAPEIGPVVPDFPAAEAVPAEAERDGDVPLPMSASAWCVPDVLLGQLARLAAHPYSAYWARETAAQIESLLRADRSRADETARILAALRRSAETAAQLAEQAGDDRMRVELLRAHWSLARRVDCWSTISQIHVAALERARFAARGSLDSMLAPVAMRPDLEALNTGLEMYERMRDVRVAQQVMRAERQLRESSDPLDVALADAVEQHYRNANVRVAITAEMLNRFVPDQFAATEPVWDRIAGTPVRGQSHTAGASLLRLAPATGRWQMELESRGAVDSDTLADGGRAQVHSYGSTDFTVRKTVVVDPEGVHLERAEVSADNYSHLAGVTTDFDWVPLLGAYARSRAIDQYRAKRHRAKAEVECKVGLQASERLDQEAADAVARAQREYREQIVGPLAEFGVGLTPVEMTTTNERVVARLRLAGQSHLAGHTPRPRAPSDSLVSVQLHETALTNAAVGLGLDGRRMTATELQATLRQKLPRLASSGPPEDREDVVFQFADQGAVQFRIDAGRFEIVILVAEFERENRRIRNFMVHAYYAPVVNGLSAEFARQGALGIEGRLTASDRARLYSVFNEVLGAERRLPIVRLQNPDDPRLAGLMITQLVLEDGWLGLAVGPESFGRAAERSRSLR